MNNNKRKVNLYELLDNYQEKNLMLHLNKQKLDKENQDLLELNETLKDMNEQSQNKIKELEEEKEKLISELVKMQNELNFVKTQNDLLRIEIYNCQGELL